ncbi:MAG: hypothetical protein AAF502_01120 [Bacteroidota bacterium]
MKGYFLLLVLMVGTWSFGAGASLNTNKQSEKIFTQFETTLLDNTMIVIYQGLHSTTLDIADVGEDLVGTLLDANGKVVWNDQFPTPKAIVFDHRNYPEGTYDFILEKTNGVFLEMVSFEMK